MVWCSQTKHKRKHHIESNNANDKASNTSRAKVNQTTKTPFASIRSYNLQP
jgi:hypothetical protein